MFKTSRRRETGVRVYANLSASSVPRTTSQGQAEKVAAAQRLRAPGRHCSCAAAGRKPGGGAGPRPGPAGAGKMAAAAVAANGTGGSSGMEVDAAGNEPRGGSFRRQPSGCIKAAFLNPGRSQEGGCNVTPWDNMREGCMAQALPSPTLISWEGCGSRTLTHSPFLPHIVVPSVMASGVTGSVSVALHPLVILNISDHWIRIRSQEGRPMQGECSA